MRQYVWAAATLVCLAALCTPTQSRTIEKRQAHIDASAHGHVGYKDKEKIEQKWGFKNAILGLVFNKINSFIDKKTAWINQLDKKNIPKNAAHHIVPPKDPVITLSGLLSSVIGNKLQQAGPLLTVVTNKVTSGSSKGGHTGFNVGSLLGGSSGGGAHAGVDAGLGVGGAHAGATAYGAAI